MHHIFQRTGITPDEFYQKPRGVQAFMLASTRIYLESACKSEEEKNDRVV
nr:MAG TPA: Protein of unknown function (DUF3263) [Caudoviricetes sp.]